MNSDLAHAWLRFAQLEAGALIFTAGLIQLSVSRFLRRDGNRALIVLGVAGLLYGARLITFHPLVRLLIPAPRLFWDYLDAFVTYSVLVPMLYFIELTFGSGWRHWIRWVTYVAAAYGVTAMLIDAVTQTPGLAMSANGYLVVFAFVSLLLDRSLGRPPSAPAATSPTTATEASDGNPPSPTLDAERRVLRAGLIACAAFVIFENTIDNQLLRGAWNVEWVGILALLGSLGYIGISRVVRNDQRLRELSHELATARRIQASILPRGMPSIDGVELAARYLPMTAVAGDFYDFLELGAGRFGVLVADVSGHGVPAALIASMVKVAFIAQSEHADDPARVLGGLNQVFCGRLEGQFVTAAYAYIDSGAGKIRYGAAAHPPALLVSRQRQVEELAENGVMLGHFPQWQYTAIERPFREGDRVIFYTDGLLESSNSAGEFFDGERLRDFSRNGPSVGAQAFANALLDHVGAWSGRSKERGFDDDVTVVVVERVTRPSAASSPGMAVDSV
ncbi:MAG TPA: PP2C family protein-serine/threonine phosphatase [Vicinamibacterales bacterium]|nr:PP2C family protein-serine/threonine phosphatase [Vicinamibacterales bacterium]